MARRFFVYIMTSHSRTLYTGVTNDIRRRVLEHKEKRIEGFTSKYNISKLAWFAETTDIRAAIEHEKRIKGWLKSKKVALIEEMNPNWENLSAGWYETPNDQ